MSSVATAMVRAFLTALLVWGAGCAAAGETAVPEAVFITWQGDPTTTMTIQWLGAPGTGGDAVSYGRAGETRRWSATGEHRPLPHADCLVHRVELRGLEPGADYRFRIEGRQDELAFRTMPASAEEPITFVVGGDAYRERVPEAMLRQAAAQDPMFVVVGGDIVYDNGEPGRVERWFHWFEAWQRLMVTTDGRLIPMLAAIGNHDVHGRFGRTPEDAPFYYALFPWPGPAGCGVLDFGDYMSLIVLDSGHCHPIGGEQAEWLEATLARRAEVPHLFAVYHVPAFPSVRAYDDGVSPWIRDHWVPLFERFGLDVAFEHHDHAYKRSHPIRNGRVNPDGVLYLGDGAWGAPPRGVHTVEGTWYLARAESVNNVIVTTVRGGARTHRALSDTGAVIDAYPEE